MHAPQQHCVTPVDVKQHFITRNKSLLLYIVTAGQRGTLPTLSTHQGHRTHKSWHSYMTQPAVSAGQCLGAGNLCLRGRRLRPLYQSAAAL
jgi:hypothetical protein